MAGHDEQLRSLFPNKSIDVASRASRTGPWLRILQDAQMLDTLDSLDSHDPLYPINTLHALKSTINSVPKERQDLIHPLLLVAMTTREEVNINGLDPKKQRVMEAIFSLQEYFARGIISGNTRNTDQLTGFLSGTENLFPFKNGPLLADVNFPRFFTLALGKTIARIATEEEKMQELLKPTNGIDRYAWSQYQIMGDHAKAYSSALTYSSLMERWKAFLDNHPTFSNDGHGLDDAWINMLMEVEENLEKFENVSAGSQMHYQLPDEQNLRHAYQFVEEHIQVNSIPGGSIERPKTYSVTTTESMRLFKAWDIHKVTIAGANSLNPSDDTPLVLHVRMERVDKPAIFGYIDVRNGSMKIAAADSLYIGGLWELQLHILALFSDLSHRERSGVVKSEHPRRGESSKLVLPQHRSFVLRKEGLEEINEADEARMTQTVPSHSATLPWGSQFMELYERMEAAPKDSPAYNEAVHGLHELARNMRHATETVMNFYADKARRLGHDPEASIVTREVPGLPHPIVVAAPRVGYVQETAAIGGAIHQAKDTTIVDLHVESVALQVDRILQAHA